jgi:hypothetical protein
MASISLPETSPFYGLLMTFESTPELVSLRDVLATVKLGTTGFLRTVAHHVREMGWGGSTDFLLAFQTIIDQATNAGMSIEELSTHRMLVLSDMQFDDSSPDNDGWSTTYDSIIQYAQQQGYSYHPKIIFWNLAIEAGDICPVSADAVGVIQLTGYSTSTMMAVMSQDDLAQDSYFEKNVLHNPSYRGLVVPTVCIIRSRVGTHYNAQRIHDLGERLASARKSRATPSLLKRLERKLTRAVAFDTGL